MHSSKWAVGGLFFLASIGHEYAAHACSPPLPNVSREVFPRAGAAGLSLNTEIRLTYRGNFMADPGVLVRPAGGQPVAIDLREVALNQDGWGGRGKVVVAKAAADLLPDTTYEILDRVQLGCDGGDCLRPDPTVVATFVTGSSRDDTAPVFGGVKTVQIGMLAVCNGGACCGPYSGFGVTLTWDPAIDDHNTALVRYNVYGVDSSGGTTGEVAARFIDAEQLFGAIVCRATGYSSGIPGLGVAMKGTYMVRAVDAAGNEDQNGATVVVDKKCTGDDEDAQDPPPDSGSCSIAKPHRSSPLLPLGLFGVLLAWMARRHIGTSRRRR
jgi:hypothetical protein